MDKNKICVALDVNTIKEAIKIVEKLKNYVGMFKIGMQLYSNEGLNAVKIIKDMGVEVFLDLKYYDIPNTVANTARVITRTGVSMFNIHASGGFEMMSAVSKAVLDESNKLKINKPLVLGVTVLTSMNEEILRKDLKVGMTIIDYIIHLTKWSKKAGLDGVVASAREASVLREEVGKDFVIVTPGIRPSWSSGNDQKRITTPKEAIKNGSDYIVIGRPIIKSNDPVSAIKKIYKEL